MSDHSFSSVRSLVIDVDGVLWHGRVNMPGVAAFFEFLQSKSIPYVIATNNSARPVSEIIERLNELGVSVSAEHILTSAQAAAQYLGRISPRPTRVLVLGGQGLTEAVQAAGYELVDDRADVVLAGYDPLLTYDKLKRAALAIRAGARFIGTNADPTIPTDDGLAPGAGPNLAALQTATDVAPLVIGKPQRAMFDIAVERMNATRETTAMLGDRLDTDVQGAQAAGLLSILILTGVTTPEDLGRSQVHPDFVVQDLDDLREKWARTY